MIPNGFLSWGLKLLDPLPVVSLPAGFMTALDFVSNVIGFVNIFLPLKSLLPIILLIIAIRKFNVVMAVVNWIIRLIPFIG